MEPRTHRRVGPVRWAALGLAVAVLARPLGPARPVWGQEFYPLTELERRIAIPRDRAPAPTGSDSAAHAATGETAPTDASPAQGTPALSAMPPLTVEAIAMAMAARGFATEPVAGADDQRVLLIRDPDHRVPADELKVLFFGCTDEGACTSAILWAWYRLAGRVSLGAINEWNMSRRYARAALDRDGDATLDLSLTSTGGAAEAMITGWVGLFLDQAAAFPEFVLPR